MDVCSEERTGEEGVAAAEDDSERSLKESLKGEGV